MPEISRFYGIVIKIYFIDHNPPHFHAEYGEYRAEYNIHSLAVIDGRLPGRAHALVLEWAFMHRKELFQNWIRAQKAENVKKIRPLD